MRQEFDVIIAGAGPVGAHLAYLLSKKRLSVLILEKKKAPGEKACSGLISMRLKKLVPIDNSFVEHLIYGASFHSKNAAVSVEKKSPLAYVINREQFDRHLVSIAEAAGAKLRLSEPIETYSLENNGIAVNKKYFARVLVGADGAASTVRRLSALKGKRVTVNGVISIFDEPCNSRKVDVFYGKSIAPGFFAWKIPRGETVEYGLASKKNHMEYFRKFLKSQNREMKGFYAHPIVFGIQDTAGERVILVGDAALQVKPFSGGGVIYGLLCAKIAAKAILYAFRKKDFGQRFFQENYDRVWKEKLAKPIENGMALRKILGSLDASEFDALFRFLEERKDTLSAFDMDFLQ